MRPFSLIHLLVAICVWLFSSMAVGRALADIEPYQARVIAARALVFSGPSEKFYPSGTLKPGSIVEVYREEAGGWLGIRPPEGSFSWVPEESLSPQANGLAEVKEDDVTSLIGSELSDRRNATQVKLKRGEVVEVIRKTQIDGEKWAQIAPPAGEFRWVMASSLERAGEIGEAVDETAQVDEDGSPIQPVAASETVAISPESNSSISPTVDESRSIESAHSKSEDGLQTSNGETWRAPVTPVSGNAPSSEPMQPIAPPPLAPLVESSPPISSSPPATSPPATPSAPSTTTPSTASVPPAMVPPAVPANRVAVPNPMPPVAGGSDVQRQLTEIEVRLSRMASAPPQLWNTERLQQDAIHLLSKSQTQAERDAVKATMAKIEQFNSLARKYQQGAANAAGGGAAIGNPRNPALAQLGVGPADAGRYDAVGVLRPVVSKRPGAPQFALVDDRGQVVTFVTPTPDVNLQPYLGRRVGVAGNRGFMPEFNRAHVTAGRVTPLVR